MTYKVRVKSHKRKRNGSYKVKAYTRKKAEKKVKIMKVAGKKVEVLETKNYIHYRIRPKTYGKVRILDIGEPKRHQLVRVETPKGWVTKSVRVQKGVRVSPRETKEIIRKAILYQQ